MNKVLLTARRVLFSWQFLINLFIILIITSWVPLLNQTVEMRDTEGRVIHQSTTTSRAYQSWWIILSGGAARKAHLKAVALHGGLCFCISFIVWFLRSYWFQDSNGGKSVTSNHGGTSQEQRDEL